MSSSADRILGEALHLPISERARVASALIASIDGPPDRDAAVAWGEEIERRARRVLAGESTGEEWEAVLRRVRADLAGK